MDYVESEASSETLIHRRPSLGRRLWSSNMQKVQVMGCPSRGDVLDPARYCQPQAFNNAGPDT